MGCRLRATPPPLPTPSLTLPPPVPGESGALSVRSWVQVLVLELYSPINLGGLLKLSEPLSFPIHKMAP